MTARRPNSRLRTAALLLAATLLAGCQDDGGGPKALAPVPPKLVAKMDKLGMSETSPVYMRVFKEESELEVWKQRKDGQYALLVSYPICKWSGKLGPKIKEGDRQAPEGFYTVTPGQMNPNSSYYLSFNIGYPNAYDRAYGRTGSNLMVHGACSSAGCYSMTDQAAGEIYSLARDAFRGGQRAFEVHAFPFKMTAENLARHADDPNMPFWQRLREGYNHFEVTRKVPAVSVCGKDYKFDADFAGRTPSAAAPCPAYTVPEWIEAGVKQKQAAEDIEIAALVEKAKEKAVADAKKAAEEAERAQASAPAPGPDLAVVKGEPAPGVPLPTPSPVRAAAPVQAYQPAEPPEPGLFERLKRRLPWG